jgi:hypothetical protein
VVHDGRYQYSQGVEAAIHSLQLETRLIYGGAGHKDDWAAPFGVSLAELSACTNAHFDGVEGCLIERTQGLIRAFLAAITVILHWRGAHSRIDSVAPW